MSFSQMKVYITAKIPEIAHDMLVRRGFMISVNDSIKEVSKKKLFEVFKTCDAVLTMMTDKVDGELIAKSGKQLKVIANYAVGYDNIDVVGAKRRGIVVTNTPGVAGESVAEHTFALILACAKRIIERDKYVRSGKFEKWDPMGFLTRQIWGQTIGIIGLGRIGTYVGHIAYGGFRMNILYHDILRSEDFEMLTDAKFVSLDKLLKESDVVTLHIPLAPKTLHLIGRRELLLMKRSAILINTARGSVVDEKALIEVLSDGKIAAAGLDVFEHEPSISRELRVLPNVVLTPHVASATLETREAMAKIAAQNIIDVFEGRTPFGLVNTG